MIHVHVALPTPTMTLEEKRAAGPIPNDTLVPDKPKVETGYFETVGSFIKDTSTSMGINKDHAGVYGTAHNRGTNVSIDVCPTLWIASVQISKVFAVIVFVLVCTGNARLIPGLTNP